MKVRFVRWLAVGFLVLGGALVIPAVVQLVGGETDAIALLLPGLLFLGFGIAYLGPLPYVVVTDHAIRVPIQRGPAGRVAREPGDRLDGTGRRLALVGPGGRQDTPVYRFFAHPADWEALTSPEHQGRAGS